MQTALQAKNKLGFIEGKVKQPAEGEPHHEQWVTCNSMLVSWIFNHLDEDLHSSVAGAKNAKVLWDDLKERFSQGNETRIHQLKTEICLLRQEKKSVSEYYSKLKSLWDELDLYLNLPVCSCDAGAQLAAHKEKERVHQFLIGLNPDFSTIRSQILSMDPLPTVNRAHSMAAHDETQRLITQSRDSSSEALGFAAKIANEFGGANPNFVGTNRGDFKPRGRPFCDFCGRNGHHRATCYQLHGYPHSDQSNQRSSKGFSSGHSRYGGKTGGPSSSVPAQKGNMGFGFGSSNSGQSGNFHMGGSSQARPAQTSRGQWRPNQAAQLSVPSGSAGHMAAQAQAHGDQLADISKLAHLSEGQLQQLLSMVSRDDGEINRLSGPHLGEYDWSG
ncbi:uncharacterized protein LOC116207907 [Punica granatum]|uniref:Uncharacterized protein LOC116207907 n=1 Tax=Punica granatum TaxID=22663 RepID=A0A6P8DKU3_PUNGR|nr:uncharacterized protein LOC116207907 [Punica granatum]